MLLIVVVKFLVRDWSLKIPVPRTLRKDCVMFTNVVSVRMRFVMRRCVIMRLKLRVSMLVSLKILVRMCRLLLTLVRRRRFAKRS